MKIKFSPMRWNEHAKIEAEPNTIINYINENSVEIDGELYEFEGYEWEDIRALTNEKILEAHRENEELYLTIRRFYTVSCNEWDTGDYHSFGSNV